MNEISGNPAVRERVRETSRVFTDWFVAHFAGSPFATSVEQLQVDPIIRATRNDFTHDIHLCVRPTDGGSWSATQNSSGMATELRLPVGATPDRYRGLASTLETTQREYAFFELSRYLRAKGYETVPAGQILEVRQQGRDLGQLNACKDGSFEVTLDFGEPTAPEMMERLEALLREVTVASLEELHYKRPKMDNGKTPEEEVMDASLDLI